MNKDQLKFELNKLNRRVGFRSNSRVESSLFFHVLYSILIEMNRCSEEFLEQLLINGYISFDHFDEKGKVKILIHFEPKNKNDEINDDEP